ncbi:MAG TPA: glycosyltransferase family 39 protein [Candidatus Binataceae bacterium]|nr:glycosyltransferase family 39 protein [Candidatus Binataceae bacterium]
MDRAHDRLTVPTGYAWRLANDRAAGALFVVVAVAFAIRLYLSLTSYCISGDGVGYLAMAREFAAGQRQKALSAVFSPLYPLLIAQAHRVMSNWELAGDLVSVVFGTAAVVSVYLMTWQAFRRRDIALGAAILMAIHPETTAYSASVRTEAGYICLMTAGCWMLLKALHDRRAGFAALAGLVGGLGYLYRTEGIGLLLLGIAVFPAAAIVWKRTSRGWALGAAAAFTGCFVVVAAPYIAYLRFSTGHWSVGRELTAAMMYGMGDVASNGGHWRELGFSPSASPLTAILADPALYAEKVGDYLAASTYNFVQGLEPLLVIMLAIGLWSRGRSIVENVGEAFLAAIVLFYFFGFSLSYTGTRFMVHLIPYTFGWVVVGILAASDWLARLAQPSWTRSVYYAVAGVIALTLLPRALWPIGFDMRGVRYAGEDIARISTRPAVVAARDGRVAYYADARFVELPPAPIDNLCGWLGTHDRPNYLLIGNRDERSFAISSQGDCLDFVKRYPRYGSGYYDLYAIRRVPSGGDSRNDVSGTGPRS